MVMERSARFAGTRPGNHDDVPRLDAPFERGLWRKVRTLGETRALSATTSKFLLAAKIKDMAGSPDLPDVFVVERTDKSKVAPLDLQRAIRANQVVQHLFKDCENVGKVYGVWQDSKYVYTISEYCARGDVFTWVSMLRAKKEVSSDFIRGLARQMLTALEALHAKGFAHMDVRLENFHLTEDNKLKLVGFARVCHLFTMDKHEELQDPRGVLGDPGSGTSAGDSSPGCLNPVDRPPDLMGDRPQKNLAKVDIHQAGVAIFALLAGQYPTKYPMTPASPHDGCALSAEGGCDLPCRDLLQRLMAPEPEDRPTVSGALEDPWIQGGQNQSISSAEGQSFFIA